MAVAIIEHDLNTHLMGDICYWRCPDMRDFDLSCQPKIALDQEGEPKERYGNCQQQDAAEAARHLETASGQVTCSTLAFFLVFTQKLTWAQKTKTCGDTKPQANKANDQQENLRPAEL